MRRLCVALVLSAVFAAPSFAGDISPQEATTARIDGYQAQQELAGEVWSVGPMAAGGGHWLALVADATGSVGSGP